MAITRRHLLQSGAFAAITPSLGIAAAQAQSETGEPVWRHALSLFGDIKYPADFKRFDYVNPDAPKGGVARQILIGTFDNFNLAVAGVKGSIASAVGLIYESLLTQSLDEALGLIDKACKSNEALSVGLVGNCADVLPEIVARGIIPDVLTDQTSAHDPLNGYVPNGMPLEDALVLRSKNPNEYIGRSMEAMATHVRAMLQLQQRGAVTFDYGNNIRTQAKKAGVEDAYNIPGFVPEYIRPLFCEGKGPFRWVALSGDPEDIARTDSLALELFPGNKTLARWMKLAKARIQFQGLPARICWFGYGERAEFGVAINELVRRGKLRAPVVIGRDHLDTGSVASPFRETEAMVDGSDAIADWPLLNALVNTAAGASWVSIHNGGGVGIGYSQHAGMVVVADGTDSSKRRLERVLTSDPGMGILRHADAGYSRAIDFAGEKDIELPVKPTARD